MQCEPGELADGMVSAASWAPFSFLNPLPCPLRLVERVEVDSLAAFIPRGFGPGLTSLFIQAGMFTWK